MTTFPPPPQPRPGLSVSADPSPRRPARSCRRVDAAGVLGLVRPPRPARHRPQGRPGAGPRLRSQGTVGYPLLFDPDVGSCGTSGSTCCRQGPRRQGQGPVRGFGCWSTAAQAQVGDRREAAASRDRLPAAARPRRTGPRRSTCPGALSWPADVASTWPPSATCTSGRSCSWRRLQRDPGAKTLSPLRHKGWHLSQEQTPKPIPTHGKRAIDGFAWRQGSARAGRVLAAETLTGIGSDHLPYVGTWRIKEDK